MRADPKGVVEHLRRAEREGDKDLADFLAGEIVTHLERLDGIEERGEPCANCALRGPSEGTREPAEGWATDEPTEPGWYWTRTSRGHTEILRLTEGPDGKMWADDGSWCVDEVDNEWCGPLPAPPEHGEPSDA